MSPQTTVVFFLGVLVAFCLGLEFEERGEFEVKLVVKFERALAMFDSVFYSCRMLRGVDNSTIPMICTFLCEIHVFWIVRYSLPVANNLFDVTKGCF